MRANTDVSNIVVLDIVDRQGRLTMDTLVSLLPQLSWSMIFTAVDELSRDGAIVLQRRGFEYELSPGRRSSQVQQEWLTSVA